MATKGTSLGVCGPRQGRHSSSGRPSVKYKFNVDNKSGWLNFVMRQVNAVSDALNNMSNGNFKMKK